jgi:hypothetical protein
MDQLRKKLNELPPEQRSEALRVCGVLFERHKAYKSAVGAADLGVRTRQTAVLRQLEVKPNSVFVPTEKDRAACFAQIGSAAARLLDSPGNEEFAAAIETWKWDNVRTGPGQDGKTVVWISQAPAPEPPPVRAQTGLTLRDPSDPRPEPPLERKAREVRLEAMTRQADELKQKLSRPAERDSIVKVVPPPPDQPPPPKERVAEDRRAGHAFVRRMASEAAKWLETLGRGDGR